jgi:hypothetical protein
MRLPALLLFLVGCVPTTPTVPPPVTPPKPAPTQDAGSSPSHCIELCDKCGSTLTPDGGSCVLSCHRVLNGGTIDPVCVASATNCDDALKCIQ